MPEQSSATSEVRLELDGRDDEEISARVFLENGDMIDLGDGAFHFVDEETIDVSIDHSLLPGAPTTAKLQVGWWGGVTRVDFHIDE